MTDNSSDASPDTPPDRLSNDQPMSTLMRVHPRVEKKRSITPASMSG